MTLECLGEGAGGAAQSAADIKDTRGRADVQGFADFERGLASANVKFIDGRQICGLQLAGVFSSFAQAIRNGFRQIVSARIMICNSIGHNIDPVKTTSASSIIEDKKRGKTCF